MDTKALLSLDVDDLPRLSAHTQALQQKLLVLDYGCWLAELAETHGRAPATKNFLARYPRSPGALLLQQKAAVTPGTTTDLAWAGALVSPMEDAFVKLVRSASLLGRIPGLRKIPFNVKVPVQTSGAVYQWVPETGYKPASALAFSTGVTLGLLKHAAIVVVTRELVQAARAGFSGALIEALESDLTAFTDTQFLDPTVAAVAGKNPASVTNGTTPVASTGTYATDVQSLLTAYFAANPRRPVLITSPAHASAIKSMNGGGGLGVDVIDTEAAGGITVAMDPSGVFVADHGVEVNSSSQASVQMNSTPDSPATATTVQVSLWQTNAIGYHVERFANWQAVSGAVKYLAA